MNRIILSFIAFLSVLIASLAIIAILSTSGTSTPRPEIAPARHTAIRVIRHLPGAPYSPEYPFWLTPEITGTLQNGQTLTTTNGTWLNSPNSFTYQWQDCNATGLTCSTATGTGQGTAAYTLNTNDVGSHIDVIVTASNLGGSTPATSALTNMVSATLPSGVTLQAVDGNITVPYCSTTCNSGEPAGTYSGSGYYGAWSNGLPTATSFYPIAVFNQGLDYDGSNDGAWDTLMDAYKSEGINTLINLYSGYDAGFLSSLQSNGFYAINAAPATDVSPHEIAGFNEFDEADGNDLCGSYDPPPSSTELGQTVTCSGIDSNGRTAPATINQVNADLAGNAGAGDPTRMTYCQYTKPVAEDSGLSATGTNSAQSYEEANCNIVSYDSYVQYDGYATNHDLWRQAQDVLRVRQQDGESVGTPGIAPVMPFIEAGNPMTTNGICGSSTSDWDGLTITPAQEVAEAWDAVIAGARGIEWFDHNFDTNGGYNDCSSDDLADTNAAFTTLQANVKGTDTQLENLASILNDPSANGYVTSISNPNPNTTDCIGGGSSLTANASADWTVKYDAPTNKFYLFIAPCYSGGSETLTVQTAGTHSGSVSDYRPVELGINGSGGSDAVTMTSGGFTVTLADSTDVHYLVIPNP